MFQYVNLTTKLMWPIKTGNKSKTQLQIKFSVQPPKTQNPSHPHNQRKPTHRASGSFAVRGSACARPQRPRVRRGAAGRGAAAVWKRTREPEPGSGAPRRAITIPLRSTLWSARPGPDNKHRPRSPGSPLATRTAINKYRFLIVARLLLWKIMLRRLRNDGDGGDDGPRRRTFEFLRTAYTTRGFTGFFFFPIFPRAVPASFLFRSGGGR